MDLKAKLVDKVSKNNKSYKCIEIYLTDTYKKIVFLENSEIELLKLTNNNDLNDSLSFR